MPLYALDEIEPEFPPLGRFWIAPDAHVIDSSHLSIDGVVAEIMTQLAAKNFAFKSPHAQPA